MGSGSIRAGELSVKTVDISIAGSGDCTIDATDKLNVNIAGSGDIYYLGSPENQPTDRRIGIGEEKIGSAELVARRLRVAWPLAFALSS